MAEDQLGPWEKVLEAEMATFREKLLRLREAMVREDKLKEEKRLLESSLRNTPGATPRQIDESSDKLAESYVILGKLADVSLPDALCVLGFTIMGSDLHCTIVESLCLDGTVMHPGDVAGSPIVGLIVGLVLVKISHMVRKTRPRLAPVVLGIPLAFELMRAFTWALEIQMAEFPGAGYPRQVFAVPIELFLLGLIFLASTLVTLIGGRMRLRGVQGSGGARDGAEHQHQLAQEEQRAQAYYEKLKKRHQSEFDDIDSRRKAARAERDEALEVVRGCSFPRSLRRLGSVAEVDQTIEAIRDFTLWARQNPAGSVRDAALAYERDR